MTTATSKALVKPQETYSNAKFVFTTKTKEIFNPLQVRQMMEIDFIKPGGKNIELSIEDQRFVKKLSDNIQQQDDSHYVMPLPLKSNQIALPNNRPLAFKRLMQLKCRFRRNPLFRQDYVEFMNEIITNWAEKIPDFELNLDNGNVNYVPHTGVYHPKKPGKIRVVFDCSAEFEGVSINDYLLRGPNLMNGLVGVLCRFRLEEVALVADIKAMFHQFLVCKGDRDLLRFLWWENGDTKKTIKEYRMMVHLFGAVSSPGCANFGLKRAPDNEIEFGEAAANFVRNNFYVDDGLISVSSVKEAIDLLQNSRYLCARAGLKLHEVVSNKLEVLECLPESDRATSKSINIRTDSLLLERALGVVWCIQNDTFQFRIDTRNKVYCSFILGKARVASLKQVTFPRLELTAAAVLANKILKDELKLADVKEYFLVDSKIVLGYINDENFRTFLTEVKCMIPLTPNHVLTKKPNLLLPPPAKFFETDQYAKERWRWVQLLSDQFWKRWQKKYLYLLQSRTKWVAQKKNMKEGDVVIISENVFEPCSQWRLGRIENLYQSEDGLVRKVKLHMADTHLDRFGRRTKHFSFLERPIHNIILLISAKDEPQRDNC